VPSQHLTEPSYLPIPLLSEQNILRRSSQLILALQLHFAILVKSLLFLWEICCFPHLFRCLLLKYLPHPKWSHLCHCFYCIPSSLELILNSVRKRGIDLFPTISGLQVTMWGLCIVWASSEVMRGVCQAVHDTGRSLLCVWLCLQYHLDLDCLQP
jgi:hypothetical protein